MNGYKIQFHYPFSRRMMSFFTACAMMCLCATSGSAANVADKANAPQARMGINLAPLVDWGTEQPFVDIFRLSRLWASQQKGTSWGKGPALELDEHGWVKKLEQDCWAETILCNIPGDHYPSGRYTILYEGKGTFDVTHAAKVVDASKPGRIIIDVDASKGGIHLRLLTTDPQNYIRNIRVIKPGFEATYQTEPFDPVFLRRWKGVACIRFMPWMMSNDLDTVRWDERTRVNDASFAVKGAPLEVMIDLCNRQKADAWFSLPYAADDDYVRNFAAMVKERLDPSLKVYVEYTNEAWNSGFKSSRHVKQKAKELGLGNPSMPWEGGCLYYRQRSLEIFKIWENVFGRKDRLVRVLAWQAASSSFWLDGLLMSKVQPGDVDALAVGPYISVLVPDTSKNPDEVTADKVATWTVDQVLDYTEKVKLPECVQWMHNAADVARKHHVRLIAYEAGQHLVGIRNGMNNEQMTQLFIQANAHPRMGQIYTQYFDAWQKAGGELMCVFESVSRWSKYGSWGLMQFPNENESASPKFLATMRWAKSLGQNVNVSDSRGASPRVP
ncbi:MAG: hypothetical protein WC661_02170 [Opitutaceae bacterium]